jgi:uncharacterized protein (DUF433 family)
MWAVFKPRRKTMPTPTTTLRLDARLRADIDRMARKSRRTFSEVTHALLDEALRMRACPGIYFADEPAGREAKIAGTGLAVWEVIRDFLASGRDERKVRKAFPTLSAAQVRAAVLYYEKYRTEVDAEIAENAASAPEAARAAGPA